MEYLTKAGELHVKSKAELPAAAYRWSAFMDMPDLAAITAATFHLHLDATAHERAQAMATRSVHYLCDISSILSCMPVSRVPSYSWRARLRLTVVVTERCFVVVTEGASRESFGQAARDAAAARRHGRVCVPQPGGTRRAVRGRANRWCRAEGGSGGRRGGE